MATSQPVVLFMAWRFWKLRVKVEDASEESEVSESKTLEMIEQGVF